MVNIFLITGCLGSGKTTFLKNTLTQINGKKVGVLINEFGRIGIDGTLVEKNGVEKIELNNGSIFCSCLKDHFIDGLLELADSDLEYIFIEGSGLADPSNMGTIIDIVRAKTDTKLDYKGCICLIDSLYFEKQLEILVSTERQVDQSNLILINKTDLLEREEVENIEMKIKKLNSHAKVTKTISGRVSWEMLDKIPPILLDKEKDTINQLDNKPSVFTLEIDKKTSKESLFNFLHGLKEYCYRIKGLVKIGEEVLKIDTVMDTLNIQTSETKQEKEIVVMSKKGIKILKNIREQADKVGLEYKILS